MKSIRELQWSDDVCTSDAQGIICVTESAMIISVGDVFLSSCLLQSSPTPSMKSPTKMPQYFQPNMLPPPPPPPVARPVAIIRTTDGQATVVSTPGGLMSSGRPDSFSAYVSLYVSTVTMPYWHVSRPCYVATAGSEQALSLSVEGAVHSRDEFDAMRRCVFSFGIYAAAATATDAAAPTAAQYPGVALLLQLLQMLLLLLLQWLLSRLLLHRGRYREIFSQVQPCHPFI